MFTLLFKHLGYLLFPGGLAIGLALWYAGPRPVPAELGQLLPALPWLTVLLGGFLGWRFNRSRLLFYLLLLALAAVMERLLPSGYRNLQTLLWFLLPANAAVIACAKDRGVSLYSLWYPLLLIAQPGLVLLIWKHAPTLPGRFLEEPFWTLFDLPAGGLAGPAQFAFLAALLVLCWTHWRRPGPFEGNQISALVLIYIAGTGWTNLPLETCLALAGLALAVAVIEASHSMAYRDELTALPGRRALNETFARLPARYVVAMLDVDHFKKVNDRHGHDVGDQVLKMVAARLQQAGRPGRPFRYGGEEFTLLFPGKSLEEALPVLERVRQAVAANEFVLRRPLRPKNKPALPRPRRKTSRLKMTISIGAAAAGGEKTPEEVLKKADQALYRAKQGGRNRVVS